MKRSIGFILAVFLLGQSAFAEVTAEAMLLELMQNTQTTRYASGSQPNYQVTNACFYTLYLEWESRYMEILKKTPLDDSKITTLNLYADFAASIRRDVHVLKAYYPNLFSNVNLYIQRKRSLNEWPATVNAMAIDDIKTPLLRQNFEQCFSSDINMVLANTVDQADYVAGNQALDDVISATFVRSEPGIALTARINQQVLSNIPGVGTSIGADSYITEIPKKP
jgi:hypothetical protein